MANTTSALSDLILTITHGKGTLVFTFDYWGNYSLKRFGNFPKDTQPFRGGAGVQAEVWLPSPCCWLWCDGSHSRQKLIQLVFSSSTAWWLWISLRSPGGFMWRQLCPTAAIREPWRAKDFGPLAAPSLQPDHHPPDFPHSPERLPSIRLPKVPFLLQGVAHLWIELHVIHE